MIGSGTLMIEKESQLFIKTHESRPIFTLNIYKL